jgi:DNA-binding transcriptional MerR regulator
MFVKEEQVKMVSATKEKTLVRPHQAQGFYTPLEASRIAQVPLWTVNSWKRSGIVIPSVEWLDEYDKVHIGHTFETVVFLRLIRLLRDKGFSLREAVKAIKTLRDRLGVPSKRWGDAKIFTDKRDIYVQDNRDGWEVTVATRSHQKIADFLFGKEFELLKDRADALLIPKQFLNYVEIDTSIKNGLPIVLDTSVPTNLIHKLKLQGYRYLDISDMYPFIALNKMRGAEGYEKFLDKALKN